MNLFSKSSAQKHYEDAKKAFDEGNAKESLRILILGFQTDNAYKPLYELASNCLRALGGDEEAVLFDSAISNFKKFDVFYNLGYRYIDVGHYRLAIPFLERALELSPGNVNAALELSVALVAQFQPEKAYNALSKIDLGGNFWAWYEFYWCSLLSNKPSDIKEFIQSNKTECQKIIDSGNTDIQPVIEALEKLEECSMRLDLIPHPNRHIMDWHFIQYGSAILDYFDEKTEDNDAASVAGGRYVALFGTYPSTLEVLLRLKQFLFKLDRYPEIVLYLPDKNSEIVGRAAAEILGIKSGKLTFDYIQYQKYLIVAGNTSDFNDQTFLRDIKEGQTVFALNHHWLEDAALTPDVVGFMTQTYLFPWDGGGMKVNPQTNKIEEIPPDKRPIDAIVESIVNEKPGDKPGFTEVLNFYIENKDFIKGGLKAKTKRLPFRTDSPVPGSYFC